MARRKGPLRVAIEDFFDTFDLGELINRWIERAFEKPRNAMMSAARPVINEILAAEDLPERYKKPLRDVTSTDPITLTMVAGSIVLALVMGTVMGVYAPVQRVIAQWVDAGVESARASPSEAWPMTWRTPEHAAELMKHMKQTGWNESIIAAWEEAVKPRLTPSDLITLAFRELISPGEVVIELNKRGYETDDIEHLIDGARMMPGSADLIQMAVREAWRDDVASKYGYDADFPAEFAEWMRKQGDKDGWAQKYWRAHWDLPGLTTVLQIFHRLDEFTETDLNDYLRTADVPAGWRSLIAKVAYTPLTRVDVRRMYGLGVLDRDAVKRSYLDLGYSDSNAELMTEFTLKYTQDTDRELTKTDILRGFRDGMLAEAEAIEYLNAIGYSDTTARFLTTREAAVVARKRVDAEIKIIKTLYERQDITETEARTRLAALNLAATEIEQKIDLWRIGREAKVRKPTQAQLDTFFKGDIIPQAEYTAGLAALGYQDKYVDWYIEKVLVDKAEEGRKEEDRARSEQQSIRDRKVKSDYQTAKAGLDVDLAELRTAIAETQIALNARKRRYRRELAITRKTLTAAELTDTAQSEIEGLQAEIANAADAQALLREQIDGWQTEIADIRLSMAEQKEGLPAKLEAATDEEAATQIEAEAAAQALGWNREIRALQVQIEEAQDSIASLQTDVVSKRGQIAARRVQLREELALAERIQSEQELRTEYETDVETFETRLAELRVNLSRLTEDKARLSVKYRSGLAGE